MFNLCYEYKLKWNKEYYTTPILNALVFNNLKAILGGKLSFLLSGSAPLSAETQVCTIILKYILEAQGTEPEKFSGESVAVNRG